MTKRIFLGSVFALTLFLTALPPAFCTHQKIKWRPGISHYVQIPVLFMTDRAYYKSGFLNQRKLENGSIYDMYCGTLEYTIENTKQKTLTEAQKKLGWHYVNKLPKNPMTLSQLSESGKKYVYGQFGQKVIEVAKEAECDDIFVNVHGFNNPFAGSARSAARLAYTVEKPVVLYSWPSAGRIALYDVDSTNNEWSQEHYNRLMDELVGVKKRANLKFFLVAHSMGNRLAMRSASLLKGKNLFEQAFLVDPDLDAETFVHYVARYALGGEQEKEVMAKTDNASLVSKQPNVPPLSEGRLRILFSHHDNALPIVQLLFSGGYTRLGQGADSMLASLFDPTTMPNIFQGASDLFQPDGGKAVADQEAIKAKEDKEDAEYLELVKAFQWIDYTVLDHGILGHTVPYDLIASLWSTGKPGENLALITAQNSPVNRFTRFSSRIFRQSKHFGDLGNCQRVVFKEDAQNKLVSPPQ